jgi:hypothetical protein
MSKNQLSVHVGDKKTQSRLRIITFPLINRDKIECNLQSQMYVERTP